MKEFLEQYIGATPAAVVERLLPALVVLIVSGIVIKFVKKLVRKLIVKSKLRKGLYTFVEKTISVILYFVTFLIIADMLNIPITSLLAMFSVVGLAASLAVQDTLSNLASGVVILATHPFKTGDYVDVSNVSGTVKEINFTHTVLTTIDERVIRVPNKDVAGATIVNYSENFYRRVCIDFDVSYNANTKRVLSIMDEIIQIMQSNGISHIHLSIDLDGMDPSIVCGTGTKVDRGINNGQFYTFIDKIFSTNKVTSADFVEYNHLLDDENHTTATWCKEALHYLSTKKIDNK